MPVEPDREPVSGVVGAVLGLAGPQAHTGYSVEVWGWNDSQPKRHNMWNRIEMWTSPEWTWARFARWDVRWLAPVWLHALTQAPIDVLHTHVDPNLLYTPGARIRLLHLHTAMPNPFPPAYRRLLNRADGVICCSEFVRTQFLSAADYPAERTFVIYNGADLSAYCTDDRYAQRARWGVNPEDFVVLFAGAVVPEKGVGHLVRAFTQVQASPLNAVLVIAGSARLWALPGGNPAGDAYEAEVRALARDLKVRFVGNLPHRQMPAAFMASDVVVAPSLWDEPLGTVVCEAMAAGRPVVASSVGGLMETVKHNQTGLLVSPGNEAQLAEAIRSLATDADLRQQMGEAARERAKAFTWEASAQQLDGIYRDLLAAHQKSAAVF